MGQGSVTALIATTVMLTAAAALAWQHEQSNGARGDVPVVTVIYIGADDCTPCRTWRREHWPNFRASDEFRLLQYRAVESPNLLDVLKDEYWPDDLRGYRKQIEPGAAVPMWFVVRQERVVLKAYGISNWNEAVLPAIKRLAR